MWFMILGAPGSGKHAIADQLVKDSQRLVKNTVKFGNEKALNEFGYFVSRFKDQLQAQVLAKRFDVVTIHSFWESGQIFLPVAKKLETLSKGDIDFIQKYYDEMQEFLEPPTAVIYVKTDRIMSEARTKLQGREAISDEVYKALQWQYDEFIPKIKIPLIEIDAKESPEEVRKNLEFSIASFRALNPGNSIWKREMFR